MPLRVDILIVLSDKDIAFLTTPSLGPFSKNFLNFQAILFLYLIQSSFYILAAHEKVYVHTVLTTIPHS